MGRYLNPKNETKEAWLKEYAVQAEGAPKTFDQKEGHTITCLVDNGGFTACGLAYFQGELEAFNAPYDARPKTWWWIPNKLTDQFQ